MDAAFSEIEEAAEEQPAAPLADCVPLPSHTRVRITAAVHFIADWSDE